MFVRQTHDTARRVRFGFVRATPVPQVHEALEDQTIGKKIVSAAWELPAIIYLFKAETWIEAFGLGR